MTALELPVDVPASPADFLQAAMEWHFSPATGSPFWLERARSLDFDPRTDIRCFDDLQLFPNVTNELRDVPVRALIPKGYGPDPDIVGVYESGGTTGAPKRIVLLRDWWDRIVAWHVAHVEAAGVPRGGDWLALIPSGPHIIGEMVRAQAARLGGIRFAIDLDPRWVKGLIAGGKVDEADAYAEYLIDQAAFVLRTQDIGVVMSTPPLLERLARREELVEIVRSKVHTIMWGGAHMDPDTRRLYRTEVFPGVVIHGGYGSTMVLGGAVERLNVDPDGPCIFDGCSPYITFCVVDPRTRRTVPYDQRGQVVMNHISKSFLLPNILERDMATRVRPPEGYVGDSVADVAPVQRFEDETVIEGVY